MPEPVTHDMRVIVAGGGELGLRTAELLDHRGHDVAIVESDPHRISGPLR